MKLIGVIVEVQTNYLIGMSKVLYRFAEQSHRLDDFANSMSRNQQLSKEWLVNQIKQTSFPLHPTVLILGGWYGSYLVPLLLQHVSPKQIVFNDVDEFCINIAKQLFSSVEGCGFSFNNIDVNQYGRALCAQPYDIIINTSCEHMNSMLDIQSTNPDCIYAFQSSNTQDDPGHINPCHTSDELLTQTGITKVVYKGSLALREDKKRIMVIGYKQSTQ